MSPTSYQAAPPRGKWRGSVRLELGLSNVLLHTRDMLSSHASRLRLRGRGAPASRGFAPRAVLARGARTRGALRVASTLGCDWGPAPRTFLLGFKYSCFKSLSSACASGRI